MGQAFDREGRQLAEAFGATKKEVFDKLMDKAPDAHEVRIKSLTERQEEKDEFAARVVELSNELEEWKTAGGDPLAVVGAIQRLVYTIVNQEK